MAVNTLMNTSSPFSFSFLPNPVDIILDSSHISNTEWLDNNLPYILDLQIPSFLYNILQLFPPLLILYIFIYLYSYYFSGGRIFRTIKNKMNLNYMIILYQGIYYQALFFGITNLFYENLNLDNFSFISKKLAFIYAILSFLLLIIFKGIIAINPNHLNDEEIEDKFGFLYEGLKTKLFDSLSRIFDDLKYGILILIALSFQKYPLIIFPLYLLIFFISLAYKVKVQPFSECRDNIQGIIREALFLILVILFLIYYFVRMSKSLLYKIMIDCILLNIVTVFVNEIIFTIINLLIFLIESFSSERITVRIKFQNSLQYLQIDNFNRSKNQFIFTLVQMKNEEACLFDKNIIRINKSETTFKYDNSEEPNQYSKLMQKNNIELNKKRAISKTYSDKLSFSSNIRREIVKAKKKCIKPIPDNKNNRKESVQIPLIKDMSILIRFS